MLQIGIILFFNDMCFQNMQENNYKYLLYIRGKNNFLKNCSREWFDFCIYFAIDYTLPNDV